MRLCCGGGGPLCARSVFVQMLLLPRTPSLLFLHLSILKKDFIAYFKKVKLLNQLLGDSLRNKSNKSFRLCSHIEKPIRMPCFIQNFYFPQSVKVVHNLFLKGYRLADILLEISKVFVCKSWIYNHILWQIQGVQTLAFSINNIQVPSSKLRDN